jgi:hypothetical protein
MWNVDALMCMNAAMLVGNIVAFVRNRRASAIVLEVADTLDRRADVLKASNEALYRSKKALDDRERALNMREHYLGDD